SDDRRLGRWGRRRLGLGVGAAVVVLDPVHVLELVGALIEELVDPVAIGVGDDVRAAVGVLVAVDRLRLVRALVVGQRDAVAIPVGIGHRAAVGLGAGVVGARVGRVDQPVTITIQRSDLLGLERTGTERHAEHQLAVAGVEGVRILGGRAT